MHNTETGKPVAIGKVLKIRLNENEYFNVKTTHNDR